VSTYDIGIVTHNSPPPSSQICAPPGPISKIQLCMPTDDPTLRWDYGDPISS